jgi:L-seryl-tRNA(Ser) seleniumtransferase
VAASDPPTQTPSERRLRELPSVEELASSIQDGAPRELVVEAARGEIDAVRRRILAGADEAVDSDALRKAVSERVARMRSPSLRPVINATGVILHTNLGRAPLARQAAEHAATVASSYSNLELELKGGTRGSRSAHVEPLLCELSGAEAAIAVNNNAAAVLLALAATAASREVIVSRGELIEIGGSFRIPEILAQSGAHVVEIGTTNRTRIGDYEAAVGAETAAILHVHQSNFRTIGFTEGVALGDLAQLARDHGLCLIADLGSGAIAPIEDEPDLPGALAHGADLVCCSADKLLGGPQAGVIVGRREAVDRCRRHPLARAVRLDKLQIAALEATLRLHREGGEVPALQMLRASEDELRARAERMAAAIGLLARVVQSSGRVGGGTLPLLEVAGPVCQVEPRDGDADGLAARLRNTEPPVLARIKAGRVLLDPRTMSDAEAGVAARLVSAALDSQR